MNSPNGVILSVPEKDPDVQLKIGDIVSFTYSTLAETTPANPRIYRIRKDITWGEVLNNWRASKNLELSG